MPSIAIGEWVYQDQGMVEARGYLAFRAERYRGTVKWISGAVAAGVLVCGIAVGFTGHPSAYLGVERSGVRVRDFNQMPELPMRLTGPFADRI